MKKKEIWLLQIGEQFIIKETEMKCLQSLTDFFDNTREKRTNREEISFQYKKDYFRKTLGDKKTFSCRETSLLQWLQIDTKCWIICVI